MKRYIKAEIQYEDIPVFVIDFYRMIGDLRPLKSIYIAEDNKDYARDSAERLAREWGFNPDKMIIQETGKSAKWFFENPNMQYFKDIWYLNAG